MSLVLLILLALIFGVFIGLLINRKKSSVQPSEKVIERDNNLLGTAAAVAGGVVAGELIADAIEDMIEDNNDNNEDNNNDFDNDNLDF
ncbi:hypothetical protein [Methanocaldococcus sp.]